MHPAASTAREIANRDNAQLSTGPRTVIGKDAVKLNALKHGLFSKTIVLPGENREAFLALGERYTREFNPQTPEQVRLVEVLQDTQWRLDRVIALDHNLHAVGAAQHLDQAESEFRACFTEEMDDSSRYALAQVLAFRTNARAFDQLARQEARLRRLHDRTRKELALLQVPAPAPPIAPRPDRPAPARTNGFVSPPSAQPAVSAQASPSPMPQFTGPMADIKRKQWLRRQNSLNAR